METRQEPDVLKCVSGFWACKNAELLCRMIEAVGKHLVSMEICKSSYEGGNSVLGCGSSGTMFFEKVIEAGDLKTSFACQ